MGNRESSSLSAPTILTAVEVDVGEQQVSTIFIDKDGVFVTTRSVRTFGITEKFDPSCVHFFNQILFRSRAKVVVTGCNGESLDDVKNLLRKNKVRTDNIIGKIDNSRNSRGHEIKKWLKENRYGAPIVIVNDDEDMLDLKKHLIQTDYMIGLTEDQSDKAVKMLRV